jgi:hypothetical protein
MGEFDVSISILRGDSDEVIDRMIEALRAYEAAHPKARIDLYCSSRRRIFNSYSKITPRPDSGIM